MHEQDIIAIVLFVAAGYIVTFFLGYDTGARGQTRKTREALRRFGKLSEDVKAWRSSANGTSYSRGYSTGYTDCLANMGTFLERHEDEPA